MSFINNLSQECSTTETDLFSVPLTQTSIESTTVVEYNPISSISDTSPLEYLITGNGMDYIDPSSIQLYVRVQIVRGAAGLDIDNTHHIAPVNLLLHSMFSDVEIKLNDVVISSNNSTYGYRSYLETLMSYGSDAKNSQLESSLYYQDTAGGDAMEFADPIDQNCLNNGLKKRHAYFIRNNGSVEMMGSLHSDISFQGKFLPSDVNLRIKLMRAKDQFCLMSSAANPAFRLKLLECKLLVRRVKLTSSVYLAHAKGLEISTAKYPIKRIVCKSITIPRGLLSHTLEHICTGQLPNRIVLGLVRNEAFNGSYTTNPYNFRHFNLTQLKVSLDGHSQHGIRMLECDYDRGVYIESYLSLFQSTGKYRSDEGNTISRGDYPAGYTLYGFNLSQDNSTENACLNLVREGNLRLDFKFSAPLPETINLIIYSEFDGLIEIDRLKNIITDFTQ